MTANWPRSDAAGKLLAMLGVVLVMTMHAPVLEAQSQKPLPETSGPSALWTSIAPPPDAPTLLPGQQQTLDIGWATPSALRSTILFTASAQALDRVIDIGSNQATNNLFRSPGAAGIVARLVRLWFVDMPIASLGQVLNHEYGHVARSEPFSTGYDVDITTLPWPVPLTGAVVTTFDKPGRWPTEREMLGSIGGGSESSLVMADRLRSTIYARESVGFFDLVLYTYAKADVSAYILNDIRETRLRSWETYDEGPGGDPRYYAFLLARARLDGRVQFAEVASTARSLRSGAAWNLLDYTLWANVVSVVRHYIINGEPGVPVQWLRVGRVRFAPTLNYTLSPVGPERSIGTCWQMGSHRGAVSVRWSEPIDAQRLVGAGGEWMSPRSRRVAPVVKADVWSDPHHRTGGRIEVGAAWSIPGFDRLALTAPIGAKTQGYLLGFPESGGAYALGLVRTAF